VPFLDVFSKRISARFQANKCAIKPNTVARERRIASRTGEYAKTPNDLDPTLTESRLMASLANEIKLFIVQALACYDTPSAVVDGVKEKFDVTVSRQQCEAYDPTKRAGAALAIRWLTAFEDTRKRFREEVAEIPIANRAVRLRALDRMAGKAESKGNIVLAMQIIEQAAKEMGDLYMTKGRPQRSGGAPVPVAVAFGPPSAPDYVLQHGHA
jgi:hypothetical protein